MDRTRPIKHANFISINQNQSREGQLLYCARQDQSLPPINIKGQLGYPRNSSAERGILQISPLRKQAYDYCPPWLSLIEEMSICMSTQKNEWIIK